MSIRATYTESEKQGRKLVIELTTPEQSVFTKDTAGRIADAIADTRAALDKRGINVPLPETLEALLNE